jgi:hypothetical protein
LQRRAEPLFYIGQQTYWSIDLTPLSWSGRRESNPRSKLGKLLLCH